jgi:hypothetical protein
MNGLGDECGGDAGLRIPSPEMASVMICTSSRRLNGFLRSPCAQVGDSGACGQLSRLSGVGELGQARGWHDGLISGLGLDIVLNVCSGIGSLGEGGRGLWSLLGLMRGVDGN